MSRTTVPAAARSRDLPHRSCLVFPADSERFTAKSPSTPADMCLLDLEDAVAPTEKQIARAMAAQAVRDLDWGNKVVGVRVNGWETPWTYRDVISVIGGAGDRLDEIVLPKVESPGEVEAIDLLITQVEKAEGLAPGGIGLEVQIESASGLSRAAAICASSPRLVAVVFGPADFAASMGIPWLPVFSGRQDAGVPWSGYALVQIAVAARAADIQVIDGPYFRLHDPDGLKESCRRSAACGYDGKWAVHPEQLELVSEAFTPGQAAFDQACALLEMYATSVEERHVGAVADQGEMVDEAVRLVALRTIKRGSQAGLSRTVQPGAVQPRAGEAGAVQPGAGEAGTS